MRRDHSFFFPLRINKRFFNLQTSWGKKITLLQLITRQCSFPSQSKWPAKGSILLLSVHKTMFFKKIFLLLFDQLRCIERANKSDPAGRRNSQNSTKKKWQEERNMSGYIVFKEFVLSRSKWFQKRRWQYQLFLEISRLEHNILDDITCTLI